jgi:Ran GTPase-activating protein (RanGAP) involved in mRNA processing and transport
MMNDEPGVQALADVLTSNTTLKELNISSNDLDEECAQILAPAIKNNRVLMTLTFGDKQVTMTTDMTEANFRGKLKSHEALLVAAFLPKCT